MASSNKKKIFNDPVYGFITIPSDLIYDLVEHRYFQRLRRIKQLGMSEFVYPGALHTRFHHALGAMHLMGQAIQALRGKGHLITEAECEAVQAAILLHDLGHGPFSHVLEHTILNGVHHESLSLLLMQDINWEFGGALTLAIRMFEGTYERPFFHQLISSQLDMDRMDYLNRDCFYTGVAEGTIGADRIIKMLDLAKDAGQKDRLVVEAKGILSIENFLNARRLMYWQVYLHKTSLCAEAMLIQLIRRARFLISRGTAVPASPALTLFLSRAVTLADFESHPEYLQAFSELDDYDIWSAIKSWSRHPDRVLADLCARMLERKLFKIILSDQPLAEEVILDVQQQLVRQNIPSDELSYFIHSGIATNAAYLSSQEARTDNILIKFKNGRVADIADASDLPGIKALANIVRRYYVCWARNPMNNDQ